jgi:DNA-binding CsgD family transcriptional regulator
MIPAMAEVGLLLLDLSLKLIAYDRGAIAILGCPEQPLPEEILDLIRSRRLTELTPLKIHFRVGAIEYAGRAHMIESYAGWIAEPLVAIQLERVSSASDAIDEIGTKYNLTDREQQALRGISMGLTSKEVAERMNISPNTVKAFLRLIMIKMGVTTRGGIVANLLNRGNIEDASETRAIEAGRPDHTESRAFDARQPLV